MGYWILIDAHGPDHGLSVEYRSKREIVIRQWAECCEPDDNGSYSPHIQEAVVSLETLFDRTAPHYGCGHVDTSSMHHKIVTLALNYLCYWGGEEEHVSDDDRPCQHFGMNYSGIGKRRTEPWPSHMTCETCGGKPE